MEIKVPPLVPSEVEVLSQSFSRPAKNARSSSITLSTSRDKNFFLNSTGALMIRATCLSTSLAVMLLLPLLLLLPPLGSLEISVLASVSSFDENPNNPGFQFH